MGVGCTDPCEWHDGASCNQGKVTSITLDYNDLQGNLTGWHNVSALTNLTILDFSGNSLSGGLPTEIGEIQTLLNFMAPRNQLGGTLPTQLGAMNQRFGVTQLLEIDLRANRISGTIPSELGLHSRLRKFDVRENALSGSVPSQLASVADLVALFAQDNPRLSGTVPTQIGLAASIRYLDLSRGRLSGTIPSELGGLAELSALHLASNAITGSIPDELVDTLEYSMLRTLRLGSNRITGNLPQNIGKLRTLDELDTWNNSMSGDVPASIADLYGLKYLYIQNDHLLPVRKRYCGQRLQDVGKFNWMVVQSECARLTTRATPFASVRRHFWRSRIRAIHAC